MSCLAKPGRYSASFRLYIKKKYVMEALKNGGKVLIFDARA
jgi:hypothetical protein